MSTDMVGYGAPGQRDGSLSLALVEQQRRLIHPILRSHKCREIKTVGDGLLAVAWLSGVSNSLANLSPSFLTKEIKVSETAHLTR